MPLWENEIGAMQRNGIERNEWSRLGDFVNKSGEYLEKYLDCFLLMRRSIQKSLNNSFEK